MQKNYRKYIVGGGLSGLIFQFYHPEYTIITPEVGGMAKTPYMLWLHDTPETRKLSIDLGMTKNPEKLQKHSYIGYYKEGWIGENLTSEMNLLTIQKKMSLWNKELDTSFVPKSFDMSTTTFSGPNYMRTLDLDLGDLARKLAEKADIVEAKVVGIHKHDIIIEQKKELKTISYDSLISTIPAPIFWKIYKSKHEEKEFKALPITTVVTEEKPIEYNNRFEMVYYDNTVRFSRISRIKELYAIEFTGEIDEFNFHMLYPRTGIIDLVPVKFGRIIETDPNLSPQKNITFLGRFAEWKFGITSEHVVKKTLDYK